MMKNTGVFKATRLISRADNMDPGELPGLRTERFKALVRYAVENSPCLMKKYEGLDENTPLEDFPVAERHDMAGRIAEWVTDRELTYDLINRFMFDSGNIGRLLHGKYLMFAASGREGAPFAVLHDETSIHIMDALDRMRACNVGKGLFAGLHEAKTADICDMDGFYIDYSRIRYRSLSGGRKESGYLALSVRSPVNDLAASLNNFQPEVLKGDASVLESLIPEQGAGRLNIRPSLISCRGAALRPGLAEELAEAFKCRVREHFSLPEAGVFAFQCGEGNIHVNSDWVILEPVDRAGRPAPDGTFSDSVLLTNLANYIQPFIRYRMDLSVMKHADRCKCGSPHPYITFA